MTVQDYLRVVRERWLVIVLAVVLGLIGALAAFLVRPPEYTAQLSLYVSAQVGDNPQQAYQGAQLSEQRVKSYNELVTSDRVTSETIRRLGLDQTPEQLASHLTATSALDSVIINIAVTEESPEQAASIANTVGTVVTQVVDELERPAAPNGIAPVAVRVVQPAPIPDQPSSTGLPVTLALGLLAGLAVGVGAAFVRNALDTSVKTVEQLSASAGAPNLGAIAFDSKVLEKPLTVQDDPQSARAEAFRQLRTNLQFIDVDNPRKVILVTSSMPGEGKTTTVANLAIALSSMGTRLLVIEGDLRRPKLSAMLGLDRSVGLSGVLSGRVRLSQAVQPWGGGAFDVLSTGPTPPNPAELLGSNQMRALLDEARSSYDIVLIDTPPLLPVTDAAAIAPATDGAVIVCRFRQTTRPQVEAAAQALRSVSVEPLGTVFTMVPDSGPLAYAKYNSYYSAEVAAASPAASAPSGPTTGGSPAVSRPRPAPQGQPGPQGQQAGQNQQAPQNRQAPAGKQMSPNQSGPIPSSSEATTRVAPRRDGGQNRT
ncbi:capsular exopolysaccharide synthesis family protein [Pseudonocardia sediminis]|uniref:non-specific protein-tyrosine kinase n=1 Tax=Pseudonocardia sediminis TaxID=1397368 RepID=A0A4Q7V1C0_PSEST|nr:polysaccharide biosynthesis tyrosine autokinase [Pseudonocardia sediminis]RZT87915.1 capsular exopolysaccharide synthesis family protein [Pseudonocardia sediminis]